MIASTTLAALTAAAAIAGAGTGIYAATQKPKAPGAAQAEKAPDANVYKDRNAQNALLQGNAGTGTGSLLTSNSVAGNTLLGQ